MMYECFESATVLPNHVASLDKPVEDVEIMVWFQ